MTKLIMLDCDGVLVDYNSYYGKMYERIFNKKIDVINHNSYHAENYYGLNWENSQQKDYFLKQFNLQGWHDMSALDGAVEATQTLKQQGYKIIILTSIPRSAQEKRHQNLLDLGMPIDATIACGGTKEKNPKKAYIEALNPLYFVDDLKENFHGIQSTTKHVLIHGNHDDSPNKNADESIKIHHTFSSLKEFVDSKFKQKKK